MKQRRTFISDRQDKKIIALKVFILLFAGLSAQEQQSHSGKDSLCGTAPFVWKKYFTHQYKKVPYQYAFKASTKKELEAWQHEFREALKKQLGISRLEEMYRGYFPSGEKQSTEDLGSFIREKWYIWTEPEVPLPVYILIPKDKKGKLPLVITPHGHSKNTALYAGIANNEEEYKQMKEGERDVAVQAVQEGYIAIAPTTRGFGETRKEDDIQHDKLSSCRDLLVHDLLIGRTPIGDRVWDMSRIIDWAIAHLPVDAKRIAITGNSGGGTVSLFTAACDTRITVAVPSCYFCTFKGSIGSIGHCECNYFPGMLTMGEMYDIAGLIAPRPFCSINGRLDDIFPIQETLFAFEQLKKIYHVAGAAGNCELYIGEGGHRYYKDGAWPFIKKHFEKIK